MCFVYRYLFFASFILGFALEASKANTEVNKGPVNKTFINVEAYYSKEWKNIHTKPGYKSYDERVFQGFWLAIILATLLATFYFCYRIKFPKKHPLAYSRFDFKRGQCIGNIVKGNDDEAKLSAIFITNVNEKSSTKRNLDRLDKILDGQDF